jgi:GDPmannose 4,6-dehydratase
MKKIFITGITGQDGLFMTSKLLKNKGIKVYGSSRRMDSNSFYEKLKLLGVDNYDNLTISKLDLLNSENVNKFIYDLQPDTVVNLSGPSSVYKSLGDDRKSFNEIILIFDNIIKAIKRNSLAPTIFQASSSEMFKDNSNGVFDENSQLKSLTPYAEAKVENHLKTIDLYKNDGLKIHSGIMFNHESEFRDDAYLIMQVIKSAKNILDNRGGTFTIGSLDLVRDWSFAGDIVDAILKIIENGNSNTYVIGSGIGTSIKTIVKIVFNYFELDYEEFLVLDSSLNRKNNAQKIVSNPSKIHNELGWKTSMALEDLIVRCIEKNYK